MKIAFLKKEMFPVYSVSNLFLKDNRKVQIRVYVRFSKMEVILLVQLKHEVSLFRFHFIIVFSIWIVKKIFDFKVVDDKLNYKFIYNSYKILVLLN
jgi:hypothetical protein